jgi:hypothetical protein
VLLVAGIGLPFATKLMLYPLAGVVLVLIFTGVRNAWDVVTYIAARPRENAAGGPPSAVPRTPAAEPGGPSA